MRAGDWIGVDLDGTMAVYDGWKGHTHIGAPIPAMVERVKREHVGVVLEITCRKDMQMVELWDDRAVAVEANTGRQLTPSRRGL